MRIALDATYSVDPQPSGIAVYSRRLLSQLAHAHPEDKFIHCYRLKQWIKAPVSRAPNVERRILQPPLQIFGAEIFHGLNQRLDRRHAPKVVCTFHDLFVISAEYSSPEFRRHFTERARRAAGLSDLIIAVSEFTAEQVSDLLSFERSRIRVVPHGVEEPKDFPQRNREHIILFVGVLQARKNLLRLIEAFEIAIQELRRTTIRDQPWKLVLAGATTGYDALQIVSRVAESRWRDRIEVTGYLGAAELEDFYWRASIFAFPSLDEGFGIPVLEAMAHNVPVVTSNRSALPEVAGESALLVDPNNTGELSFALQRLMQDSELRAKLSALGRARAKLYSWHTAVEKTYAVYRELAD